MTIRTCSEHEYAIRKYLRSYRPPTSSPVVHDELHCLPNTRFPSADDPALEAHYMLALGLLRSENVYSLVLSFRTNSLVLHGLYQHTTSEHGAYWLENACSREVRTFTIMWHVRKLIFDIQELWRVCLSCKIIYRRCACESGYVHVHSRAALDISTSIYSWLLLFENWCIIIVAKLRK